MTVEAAAVGYSAGVGGLVISREQGLFTMLALQCQC